ncbi:MAG: M81 family metallopeptidase [bacterium]
MTTQIHIAIGGFQHETNTFAPHQATYEEFVKTDGWPGLTTGDALFPVMSGLNIPLSGFIEAAKDNNHRLLPMLWCAAEPSSYVTAEAFECVADMFCQSLRSASELDAVYLDLHGAMVVETFEDGEGELLRRVRQIVGPDIPVVVSLDLHANITEAMVDHATAISIFRTYPHLDMAATGARAFELMSAALTGQKIFGGMRKIPFLFPLTSQCTDFEPCRSIYQDIVTYARANPTYLAAEFATGFPAADIYECGAAVVAYGFDEGELETLLDRCLRRIMDAEPLFSNSLWQSDDAVQRAIRNKTDRPIILADAQDNPGAGGTSDTTGLLEALVNNGAVSAVLGVLHDPEIADKAHRAGLGAEIEAPLGGKCGTEGVSPFAGQFIVERLGDGNFTFTGDMYKDSIAQLGPMALLRVVDAQSEVRVIVGSTRVQCLDQAIFRHLGVEPSEQKIVAVKSSVHFRADFDPIAAETLVVVAPGAHPCELSKLSYLKLRPGVRLEPMAF